MFPPITPSDLETIKAGGELVIWAGKHIRAWLESRQTSATQTKPTAKRPKKTIAHDVALVVRISRMNVADVRAFLAARQIQADLIVISNSQSDEVMHLPNDPEVWEEIVREFYSAFTKIQAQFGSQRFHIFLAAPAALAFAMGCTMSTLYDVHLYQWDQDQQNYAEVIRGTSRKRLMAPAKSSVR